MSTTLAPPGAAAGRAARLRARLVACGRPLVGGALSAWAALTVTLLASAAAPIPPLVALFAAGLLGFWAWLLAALLIVGVTFVPWRPGAPPAPTAPRTTLATALVALAAALPLWWIARPLAPHLVPAGLDLRAAAGRLLALAAAAFGAAALALVLRTWVWRAHARAPRWLLGLAALGVRGLGARELGALAYGRLATLELGLLVLLTLCFAGTGARRGRGALAAGLGGAVALVAAVVATFSLFGTRPAARAALSDRLPGPAGLAELVRDLIDADADGYSPVLGGLDCDDGRPQVNPGALELVGNGLDDNCLGGDLARWPERAAAPPERKAPGERRSVVLITIDAWRADTLAAPAPGAGDPASNLRRFAAGGTRFARAYAQAPFTSHSLRALVTGRYPMDAGDVRVFLGQEETLAERLGALGYQTAALQQVHLLDPYLLQGFQRIDTDLAAANLGFHGQTSAAMTDKALAALARLQADGRPFLLWVHYFDLHSDYLTVAGCPLPGTTERERYLQELWSTDRHLGRLFDALSRSGFLRGGLVALTGDHGELLGEKARFGHAWFMDEAVLRVPLILRGAGLPATVVPTRVRLLDLYPTLLELAAGLHAPSDGRPLGPVWRGEERSDRDVFVEDTYRSTAKRGALVGPWKLVQDLRAGTEHLYRLDVDPDETTNRIDDRPADAARLREALGRWWDLTLNDALVGYKRRRIAGRLLPDGQTRRYRHEINLWYCRQGDAEACQELREEPPAAGGPAR